MGRRARRTALLVGVAGSFLVILFGLVSWELAGKQVSELEGLISQMQLLIAVTNVAFALVLTIATVYYAARTGELVELSAQQTFADEARASARILSEVTGQAIRAVSYSTSVAGFLSLSPWRRLNRVTSEMGTDAYQQSVDALADLSKAVDELGIMRPELGEPARHILYFVTDTFEECLSGQAPSKLNQRVRDLHKLLRTLPETATSSE